MQLVSVTAFLCLLDYSFRGVEANVPSPTVTRPQLQIVYNDKLRQAMKRFNITEADMSEMLTSYTESGTSPTITKSILNPETGLQEVCIDYNLLRGLATRGHFIDCINLPEIKSSIKNIYLALY